MNPEQPFISIIISVYNNAETLPACLDSLLSISYNQYEIVLINDASTDNTLKIMREYEKGSSKIKVVTYESNKGVPGARNEGMKIAQGDIFVFSDGDCTFEKEWPTSLIEALIDQKIGAAGGRDKSPPNEPLIKKCIDYTMTSFIGTAGLRGGDFSLAKYTVTGCNFAIKREVVDKIGMHNEKIRWRGEEKEWSQRIREGGYEIKYVADSFVLHYRRISLKSFWKQTYKSGKARYDIIKASPKAFEWIHLAPSLFIIFLLAAGLLSFFFPLCFYLFLGGLTIYIFINLIQAIIGAIKIRIFLALFIIPLTTMIMHFAYGLGLMSKFFSNEQL